MHMNFRKLLLIFITNYLIYFTAYTSQTTSCESFVLPSTKTYTIQDLHEMPWHHNDLAKHPLTYQVLKELLYLIEVQNTDTFYTYDFANKFKNHYSAILTVVKKLEEFNYVMIDQNPTNPIQTDEFGLETAPERIFYTLTEEGIEKIKALNPLSMIRVHDDPYAGYQDWVLWAIYLSPNNESYINEVKEKLGLSRGPYSSFEKLLEKGLILKTRKPIISGNRPVQFYTLSDKVKEKMDTLIEYVVPNYHALKN